MAGCDAARPCAIVSAMVRSLPTAVTHLVVTFLPAAAALLSQT